MVPLSLSRAPRHVASLERHALHGLEQAFT